MDDIELSESDEDENTQIELTRSQFSPPKKRQRLNNNSNNKRYTGLTSNTSILANLSNDENGNNSNNSNNDSVSNDDDDMDIDEGNNNKKKKRFKRPAKRKRSSMNNDDSEDDIKRAYRTGEYTRPGTIISIQCQNFLCHGNFCTHFCPNFNIINGANGSGKSAIEAAISLCLGSSAKKTGRSSNVQGLIKHGRHKAEITICISNEGPEAYQPKKFGDRIYIRRVLSKSSNGNGNSTFKIAGTQMKFRNTRMKEIKNITSQFNVRVDNPCVILTQENSKKFLSESSDNNKFNFFMAASNLKSQQDDILKIEQEQVDRNRKFDQSKQDFSFIENDFKRAEKRMKELEKLDKYDTMKEELETKIKWIHYRNTKDELNEKVHTINVTQNNFDKVSNAIDGMRESRENLVKELENRNKELDKLKEQYHKDKAEDDRERQSVKNELKKLNKSRQTKANEKSNYTKTIDKCRVSIRKKTKEIEKLKRKLQPKKDSHDEKLLRVQNQLTESKATFGELKLKLKEFEKEETDNLQNDGLDHLRNQLNQIDTRLNFLANQSSTLKQQLREYSNNSNRIEVFRSSQNTRVSDVLRVIGKYNRRFRVLPRGPIGYYVKLKSEEDCKIVQIALSSVLDSYLVDNDDDMRLLQQICKNELRGFTPRIIKFKTSSQFYNIDRRVLPNNYNNKMVKRISDLFTTDDAWIYNTIITMTGCDRIYAYGNSQTEAKNLYTSINNNNRSHISEILTIQQNDSRSSVSVKCRNGNFSSINRYINQLKLLADQSKSINMIKNKLNEMENEQNELLNNRNQIKPEIDTKMKRRDLLKRQTNQCRRNITNIEKSIDKNEQLESKLQDLINKNNDMDNQKQEIQMQIKDIHNEINDINNEINKILSEHISKIDVEMNNILRKISETKQSKQHVASHLQELGNSIGIKEQELSNAVKQAEDNDKKEKQMHLFMEKSKNKLNRLNNEKNELENKVNQIKNTIDINNEPRRSRKKESIQDLKNQIANLKRSRENFHRLNGKRERIVREYEKLKPQYEKRKKQTDALEATLVNFDKLLTQKKRDLNSMKEYVKTRIASTFTIIMQRQGNDGTIKIDFKNSKLDINVLMAGHSQKRRGHVDINTLSGGEKSATQTSLIMALQEFSESPFCLYDEFDVFMDDVNRENTIKMFAKAATSNVNKRQYIFITPHDIQPFRQQLIKYTKPENVKILKLEAPRDNNYTQYNN